MTDPPEHPSIRPQKQLLYHQLYSDYLQCCYLLTRYRQMWSPDYRELLEDLDSGFFNMVGHVVLRELALGVYRQTERERSPGQLTVRNLFKWVNEDVDKRQLRELVEAAKKAGGVFRDVRSHALAHRESEKAGF